jgi:hypothetical protein
MDMTALLLSRIQFAFTITFHIIFPSFTIGLAAWLTVLEAMCLATGRPVYRVIFEFWSQPFAGVCRQARPFRCATKQCSLRSNEVGDHTDWRTPHCAGGGVRPASSQITL